MSTTAKQAVALRRTELEAAELDARFEGSKRWREILDTAADLFSRQGYEATTMSDIADAVGMLKGSLYHYIKTKEDLLFHVLLEIHNETYDETIDPSDPALEQIRSYLKQHVRSNINRLSKASLFYINIGALRPDRRDVVLAKRRAYDAALRSMVVAGKGDGSVRSDVDEKLSTIAMLTALNSIYLWYNPGKGDNTERVASEFSDFFVAGLASA